MDQRKIGKFIAKCRKNVGLTQVQLADKLGITDRAISKWEVGTSLPDTSIMLELCNILKIRVNDLLAGENVDIKDYNKETEKQLIEIIKQKEENEKRLLALEWVIAILSLIILLLPIFIGTCLEIEDWQRIIIVFSGFVPAIIGFGFALKIEQIAGYYECKHCKNKYIPTFKAINLAMHMGRTRYMKCPKCGKYSWNKKVLTKGDISD